MAPRSLIAACVAVTALLVAAPAVQAAQGDGPSSGRTSARGREGARRSLLAVDYIPNIQYARDALTLVLTARLPGNAKGASVSVRLTGKGGRTLKDVTWQLDNGSRDERGALRREFDFGTVRWSGLTAELSGGNVEPARVEIACFDEDGPFPAVRPRGARLVDGKGRVAIFRLERRNRAEDRRWILLRKIADGISEGEAPSSVVIFGHPLAGGKDASEGIGHSLAAAGLKSTDKTARPGETDPVPVLSTLAAVGTGAAASKAKAAVLVLPPEDVDQGTRIEEYRRAVGLMLVRMRAAGFSPIVVMGPANFSAPTGQLAKYTKAAKEAAWGHRAGFVDPAPALDGRFFRLSPDRAGVYGTYPNEEGRKKLAKLIMGELRRVKPSE